MSKADDKAKTRNNSINMSVDDLNNPISDYFSLSFFSLLRKDWRGRQDVKMEGWGWQAYKEKMDEILGLDTTR